MARLMEQLEILKQYNKLVYCISVVKSSHYKNIHKCVVNGNNKLGAEIAQIAINSLNNLEKQIGDITLLHPNICTYNADQINKKLNKLLERRQH